ncbi:TPA: hypothetical protein ACPHJK_005285 [Enterobacter cloacae]|uniref:hypothetical protein n=1 Tax=Enterobacter cloacae TaxID=550 RepID=UPI003C700A4C
MTEPKQTGLKKGFLFGIRTGEQNKTYTLSVNADNLAEAIKEMQTALEQVEKTPRMLPENKLKGILIGEIRLTISANPQSRKPC